MLQRGRGETEHCRTTDTVDRRASQKVQKNPRPNSDKQPLAYEVRNNRNVNAPPHMLEKQGKEQRGCHGTGP